MMALWMLWATLLAFLLGVAAQVGEWLLRGSGRSGRWSWAAAMAAAVALPAWALLAPRSPTGEPLASISSEPSPAFVAHVESLLAQARPGPLAGLDPYLEAGWVAASLLLLLWLGGGLVHLALRSRSWPRARISDQDVLISRDFGPALLGVRRPRVVLPRWSLGLEPASLDMVLLHEREHARAGDGALLLVATLAVAAAPWNPALWWQLHRLRAALEMDCDARVLRDGVSPARYGRLLLALGERGGTGTLAVAGLARPSSLLERRLTMMVHGVDRGSSARRLAAGALGLALIALACETPPPTAAEAAAEVEEAVQPATPAAVGTVTLGVEEAGPMIFVDGARSASMPELAPEEIERVEVLKGRAARERYGADAEHGVVLIETRTEDVGAGSATGGTLRLREVGPDAPPAGERPEIYLDGARYHGNPAGIDPDVIDRIEVRKASDGSPSEIHIYRKG